MRCGSFPGAELVLDGRADVQVGDHLSTRKLELSPDHLRELGRLTVAYSSLEHGVARVISALIDPSQDIVLMLARSVPFARSLQLLKAAARETLDPEDTLCEEILNTAREAESAANRRNQIIHSTWMY